MDFFGHGMPKFKGNIMVKKILIAISSATIILTAPVFAKGAYVDGNFGIGQPIVPVK